MGWVRDRRTLVLLALLVQGTVLAVGWFGTFRIVRREFAKVVQERVLQQNAELAGRVASLFPTNIGEMVEYGGDEWERLQRFIETEALAQLPDGGFACLIEPDGKLLCHPEIRDDPQLRGYSFAGKELLPRIGIRDDVIEVTAAGATELPATGVIEFATDDFHYVATQPLAGTDLRLLIHQPVGTLVAAGRASTRHIAVFVVLAGIGVLGITGLGLNGLLKRYESVNERLNKQMKENLRIARQIQQATLPGADHPTAPGYEIAAFSDAADETGGDTYDVVGLKRLESGMVELGDSGEFPRVGLILADATGHGVGPALAVTQLQSSARMATRMGADLAGLVDRVNESLNTRLPSGHFVTAWLGMLDAEAHVIEGVSAGQGPLLRYVAAEDRVERVDSDLPPLAIMEELLPFAPRRIEMSPGDVFVAATDGFFEARGPDGEQFGEERVKDVIRRHASAGAEAITAALKREVGVFTHEAAAEDDRTVVVVRRA
ncbi:MAG: PP2C family protein-serine/threonine phosphatase [Planctomycetota bacterium]